MGDPERTSERDTDRTIIVDSDRGNGGSGVVIGVVVVLIVLAILYFAFRGNLERAADNVDVSVNVETPEVQIPPIEAPDINIVTPPEQNEAGQPEQNESAR